MAIKPDEWLRQAQYDMETADYLFDGERYFYAVFMCHLSIEKALKGLYVKRFNKTPPKTHNLTQVSHPKIKTHIVWLHDSEFSPICWS